MAATATLGLVNLLPKLNGNRSSGRKPFPNPRPPCLPSALRPHLPSPALPLLSDAPSIPASAAAAVAFSLPLFFHPQVSSLILRLFLYPLIAVEVMAFLGWKDALAVDGEFGLLEGRTFALVHPVVMGGLFFYTLWAGYLGWQWRRVRTIQNEINELKQAAPTAPMTVAAGSDSEASPPASPSPAEAKIQQLTEERKALLKGSYRERHYNAGSILLGFGVLEAVGGCLNTWIRTGQLFPGPHLFGGAGIAVLWALAASLVSAMQKGNDAARNLHIALNTLNVLLFVSQIPTGIDIVFKVFEFTNWP
ncbi:hypothetical protein MUK42_08962 [Musa troglodytarum]|uniref:Uncharacterized protein n=1 Tax=Musa troglodytarum TaxID=320322 RepID=A0A9E7JAG8_9LILI|nr:hypothetical protein MUK42_08962 [Musa troglodytarum]